MGRGIFLLGRYCFVINSLFGHGLWAVDKSVRIERTRVPPMYTKSACYWRSIPKLIFSKYILHSKHFFTVIIIIIFFGR